MLMTVTFSVFSCFMLLAAFFSATDGSWPSAVAYLAFAFLLARFALRAYREWQQSRKPPEEPPSSSAL